MSMSSRSPGAGAGAQWTGVRWHAGAVGTVSAVWWVWGDPVLTLRVGGGIVLVLYSALAFHESCRAWIRITPLSFYFAWYVVGLGASPLYMASRIQEARTVIFVGHEILPADLSRGYLIFLLGSLALHAGIESRRPVRPDTGPRVIAPISRGSTAPRLSLVIGLWVLGLWGMRNPEAIASGLVGSLVARSGMAALCLFALTDRRRWRLSTPAYFAILILGTVGLVVASLASGSKAYVLFSFLPLLWAALIRPQLRWLTPAMLGLGVATLLVVVMPVFRVARQAHAQIGNESSRVLSSQFRAYADGTVRTDPSTWQEEGKNFLMRQFDPTPLGYLVKQTRVDGFLGGNEMAYVWPALVPRVLWPDKPWVTKGAWFAKHLGVASSEATATSAFAISAAGEWWWNFGAPGVAGGMFLIGMAFGVIWRYAGEDPTDRPVSMVLFVTLIFGIVSMAEAVTTMVTLLGLYIVARLAGTRRAAGEVRGA